MHMIVDAADDDGGAIPFLEDAGLVCEESITDLQRNPRHPILGAVDQMQQVLDQRLRHGGSLLRPYRAFLRRGRSTQGGAAHFQCFALPWADLLRPLWGKKPDKSPSPALDDTITAPIT